MGRQGNHFRFPLEFIVRNVLLQVEALKDITRSPMKLSVLECSYDSLCKVLDNYYEHNDNQIGL